MKYYLHTMKSEKQSETSDLQWLPNYITEYILIQADTPCIFVTFFHVNRSAELVSPKQDGIICFNITRILSDPPYQYEMSRLNSKCQNNTCQPLNTTPEIRISRQWHFFLLWKVLFLFTFCNASC